MKQQLKVYIEQNDHMMSDMFLGRNWEIVGSPDEADLIQFTGGSDVDPELYGQKRLPVTFINRDRDEREKELYETWVGKKPITGICRGGQFVHVMNKGTMWQDCDNHAIGGTHKAFDMEDRPFQVTSTHHQMMNYDEYGEGKLLLWARESTYLADQFGAKGVDPKRPYRDIESIFYPNTMSLCFQPHPEYVHAEHECQNLYFDFIETYLGLRG